MKKERTKKKIEMKNEKTRKMREWKRREQGR